MHIEDGVLVADTAEDRRFLAEAEIGGTKPSDYHAYKYRVIPEDSLRDNLLTAELAGNDAILRGLARLAVSQSVYRYRAVAYLFELSRQANANAS